MSRGLRLGRRAETGGAGDDAGNRRAKGDAQSKRGRQTFDSDKVEGANKSWGESWRSMIPCSTA